MEVTASTEESVEREPAAAKPPRLLRRPLQILLFAAGVVLALLIFRSVGWRTILENLERVGGGRFSLLVLLYAAAQTAFALGWWLVIEPRLSADRFPRLMGLYLAGDALNSLAPGNVAGEPVKTRLLGKTTGTGIALASITLHKHADLLAQWLFVTAGVVYAIARFPMPLAARAAAVAGAAGLGALLLLLTWGARRGAYGPFLRKLARWKALASRLDRYHREAEAVDARIRSFFERRRGRYIASVAFCFLGWCGGVLETFLILRWLLPSADWGTALAVETLAMALNNMLIFIPGRVGSAEGVRAAVFLLLGLPAGPAAAYALLRRGRELSWTAPGFWVLVQEHVLGFTSKRTAKAGHLAQEAPR